MKVVVRKGGVNNRDVYKVVGQVDDKLKLITYDRLSGHLDVEPVFIPYNLLKPADEKWKKVFYKKKPLVRSPSHSLNKRDWMYGVAALHSREQNSTVSSVLLSSCGSYHVKHDAICNKWLTKMTAGKYLYLVTKVKETAKRGAHVKPWIDWLLNDSNWSHFIVNKDVDDVLERGMISRTDTPHNLLQQANNILRHLWEYVSICKLWYRLVENGVNKELSFLYSYSFSEGEGGAYCQSLRRYEHNIFNMKEMSKNTMLNFIHKTPSKPSDNYFDKPKLKGVWTLFQGGGMYYKLEVEGRTEVEVEHWGNRISTELRISFNDLLTDALEKQKEWKI